jgi:hypothetical protein
MGLVFKAIQALVIAAYSLGNILSQNPDCTFSYTSHVKLGNEDGGRLYTCNVIILKSLLPTSR